MPTTKVLTRKCRCTDWFESSLSARQTVRYVYSYCGSYIDSTARPFPETGPATSKNIGQLEISVGAAYQPFDSNHTLLEDIFKTAKDLLENKTWEAQKVTVTELPTNVTNLKENVLSLDPDVNGTLAALTGISPDAVLQVPKGSGRFFFNPFMPSAYFYFNSLYRWVWSGVGWGLITFYYQPSFILFPRRVGNSLSWRLIMKYFLRPSSPFRWFKKGSCQFLAKDCAQHWLIA